MLSTKLKEAAGNSADATLYVDDVFSTYLYTGNGSTQTITNGIDLVGKGGAVWIKSRDVARNHLLSYPGNASNFVIPNSATDPGAYDPSRISAFSSTGFSVGSSAGTNGNTEKYASWTFRKAAKFFDVVTYTGTGSARTIAHSLGVAPGMIIVRRTDTTGNWQVYSNGLTSAAYSIQLNLTAAQASAPTVWNSTAPTSSVFSVGTDSTVNASGGTYVAYLYAHDTSSTGIIQCGSFTTDASGNATVNLGWEPQFYLGRDVLTVDGWAIKDIMRGMPVGSTSQDLFANSNTSESAGQQCSPLATGFKYVGAASTTYIYMAIRRPNKPPTSGMQVFGPVYEGSTTPAVQTPFVVDMGISKRKDLTSDVLMGSRLQGSRKMRTNLTNAESADANYTWDYQNGYKTNTGVSTGYDINWTFKRAPGFFDVVCYTGTGVTRTVAHNLTVVPELMIVKERSVASRWVVYHSVLGNTKYIALNESGSPVTSNMWNNTTPTNAVFSVGVVSEVNSNSETYVAYLFATLAGISKVGSYTGNGSGQAIACGFGSGGARFVLIKRTDGGGGDWYTFDSARGLTSGSSPYLLLNSTAAETTGNNGVYASTGGFTLGSTASTTTNINAATYIFLAVA